MPFVPSVSVLSTPIDGKTVKIQDTTGNVGTGGNTTGYGQTTPVHNAPVVYGVVGKLLTALSWTLNKFFKAADATAIQSTGYNLTATLFGLTEFPDGVNVFNLIAYQNLGAFTVDSTGKIVTLTGNTSVQVYMTNGYTFGAAVLVSTTSGVKNIEIDVTATIADNQNNRITLKEALGAAALGHEFYIGSPAIFRFLELYASNKCTVEAIGQLASASLRDTKKAREFAVDLHMHQLAAKVAFACDDYADAHTTIVNANLKCGTGCSGC